MIDPIKAADEIYFYAVDLYREYGQSDQGVRLLGITVSDLSDVLFENVRLPLYAKKNDKNEEKIDDN